MSRIAGENIPAGSYLMVDQNGRVRRAEQGSRVLGIALEALAEGDNLRANHDGWRKEPEVQGEVLEGDDIAIQVGRPGNNNREMIAHEWGEPNFKFENVTVSGNFVGKSAHLRKLEDMLNKEAAELKLNATISRAAEPVAAKAPVNPREAQAVMAAVIEVLNFGVRPLELIAHIRLLEQEN